MGPILPWLAMFAAQGAVAGNAEAAPTLNERLTGDLVPTHDPVIAREGDTYRVFSTGHDTRLIETRSSSDLIHWVAGEPLFRALPQWAKTAVPGAEGMWAPDIAFVNGRWRLYYSVSTFGSNRSAIGLFTSPTLDPKTGDYGWRDEGLVVRSSPDSDFNAIDPNFVIDREGRHWLALGSFWTGIKLFPVDPATGKLLDPAQKPYSLAKRPVPQGAPDPIEAPFIVSHGEYYYLFASYDYCCKGVNSTYYAVVGRSREITGPYLGKDGSAMLEGGGTVFLRADLNERQRFRGPGHTGWLKDADGREYVVYHAYDREKQGAPALRIAPIHWTADGWPVADY
ncbi:arabinan endo-1,5-alpha-L-arabinosidase [Stakelama pacifica]|uniref:Extracellular exo-alpha-(1->5)-L-arabinofuranosidase n=2 Tax=Stakelama pacifica TaxID=517720 RepID=A0A4R6FP50_9SPHN|nr:arabinan endo-1,5-alpha-L-arabinosidase [Stakelama pacifica]GGO95440.1 arabinan endo-1,5-alpha-L-arabinosidase [Stakelama pacifica]